MAGNKGERSGELTLFRSIAIVLYKEYLAFSAFELIFSPSMELIKRRALLNEPFASRLRIAYEPFASRF